MTEAGYTESAAEDDHAVIERIMDDVMSAFVSVDAVIVDISLNHGGDDGISRRIARRFAEELVLAHSKKAGDFSNAIPQEALLRPNEKQSRFTGPVYLVTSDHTVSAGEVLTTAMKALPNVTHIGSKTRGALSDVLAKQLPNEWVLTLSNEVYLDRDGVLWEGRGIPPDIELQVFSPGKSICRSLASDRVCRGFSTRSKIFRKLIGLAALASNHSSFRFANNQLGGLAIRIYLFR